MGCNNSTRSITWTVSPPVPRPNPNLSYSRTRACSTRRMQWQPTRIWTSQDSLVKKQLILLIITSTSGPALLTLNLPSKSTSLKIRAEAALGNKVLDSKAVRKWREKCRHGRRLTKMLWKQASSFNKWVRFIAVSAVPLKSHPSILAPTKIGIDNT